MKKRSDTWNLKNLINTSNIRIIEFKFYALAEMPLTIIIMAHRFFSFILSGSEPRNMIIWHAARLKLNYTDKNAET